MRTILWSEFKTKQNKNSDTSKKGREDRNSQHLALKIFSSLRHCWPGELQDSVQYPLWRMHTHSWEKKLMDKVLMFSKGKKSNSPINSNVIAIFHQYKWIEHRQVVREQTGKQHSDNTTYQTVPCPRKKASKLVFYMDRQKHYNYYTVLEESA